jgi:hypothetical protein
MFISLGYLSKKMLIPLLIPVLYNIRHYLLDFFDEKIDNTDNEKHQPIFLNTFIVSISYSLNIILLFIEYKTTQSGKANMQEKEFDNQLIIEKLKQEKVQKNYRAIFLILLPLFNFFNYLSYDIVGIFKPTDYNKIYFYPVSIPFLFIITAFMSFLFLNYKFYLHQKATMIITPILSLFLLLFLIIENEETEQKNKSLTSILFLIECLGLRSLRYILYVFGKLFMEKMFVSHIKLMTFLGIFGVLFSLIVNCFSYLLKMNSLENPDYNDYFIIKDGYKRLENIFDIFGKLDGPNFLILIGIIILWFAENYIVWFCIYTFSPNHYTIYSSINSLSALLQKLIKNFNWYIGIPSILALCGIFISGLIFNEIIIIRIFKMEINTNVEINRRQKEETQISMIKFSDSKSDHNNEFPENSFDSDLSNTKLDRNSSCSIKFE